MIRDLITRSMKTKFNMKENIDYMLVPSDHMGVENETSWDVRILRGEFIETVIRYGNIKLNEERGCLNFNFVILSSPLDLTTDDINFQEYAGDILESILEEAIKTEQIQLKE